MLLVFISFVLRKSQKEAVGSETESATVLSCLTAPGWPAPHSRLSSASLTLYVFSSWEKSVSGYKGKKKNT